MITGKGEQRRHKRPAVRLIPAISLAALSLGLGLSPAAAQFQAPSPIKTVTNRPGPYDAEGGRVGSFVVFPSVTISGAYDDNLFRDQQDTEDDLVLIAAPQIEAQSDWVRHELQVFANAQFALHDDFSDEDYEDFTVGTQGRIDIRRSSNLLFGAAFVNDHEGRGDPEEVGGETPTEVDRINAFGQFNQSFGRTGISFGGRYRRLDFDDVARIGGGTINNDDRDREIYSANVLLSREVYPGLEGFASFVYQWREYDETFDDNGFQRDSEGYAINGGIEFEITRVIGGHVFAGYRDHELDDTRLEDIDGFNYGVSVDWNPTRLTSVVLRGERSVEETVQVNSPGFFSDRADVQVHHELRRNIILGATAGIGHNDYFQVDRNDLVFHLGGSVLWKLNRRLHTELSYRYSERDSDGAQRVENYTRNYVLLALTLQY